MRESDIVLKHQAEYMIHATDCEARTQAKYPTMTT